VTAVASVVITAAIVIGVLIMYLLQMNAVRRTIDSQLRTYATQIEQSAAQGTFPRVLPQSSLDANAQAQVIAADGSVIAATRALSGLPAVYTLPAGSDTPVRQEAANGHVPTEIRIVAMRAIIDGRPVAIIAGTSTDLLSQVNSEFLFHLLWGLPVILVLAAGAIWLVVGRALQPVERIRRAVTEITSADLSQRVPDPGTADQIGDLAHTMNDMLARLDAAATKQRRFVADASHELRSPLAAISTTLEVGLAHPDVAPWPTIAERAMEQSARLQKLIDQLLLLAKADEQGLAAKARPVDIGVLLREVVASLPAHHLQIGVSAEPGLSTVGNPEHLQRLFRNIIDNAVRYAHSAVAITAYMSGAQVRVEIDDDGPGIPAADRERVFDRFVRLDTSRERRSGSSGLGLAIAREIALAHDGHIAVATSPSGGAQLAVTLPHAIGEAIPAQQLPTGVDVGEPPA
jgi:signal transduction histidine kinase